MSDREFFETGQGSEVTQANMEKATRLVVPVTLGTAATTALTHYAVLPADCYLLGIHAGVTGDPGASAAAFTVKNAGGTVTYGTATVANGASAGDSASGDLTRTYVAAGTAVEVEKGVTTNAISGSVTVVATTLNA